jgi:hypothetical protein
VVEKEGNSSSSSGSGAERSGVRHRCLLQIGGRTGRAEREMGGGVGSGVPRGRWRKRGARGWQPGRGAGMAPGGTVQTWF